MKKYNNPNSANEQKTELASKEEKNLKASKESTVNQGQGPEFQTEDKNFRERNKGMTPLGDLDGQKNKVKRTDDHDSVGSE